MYWHSLYKSEMITKVLDISWLFYNYIEKEKDGK